MTSETTSLSRIDRLLGEAISHLEGAIEAAPRTPIRERLLALLEAATKERDIIRAAADGRRMIDRDDDPDGSICYAARRGGACNVCQTVTFRRVITHRTIWTVCEACDEGMLEREEVPR
ncbi:MAG: hypothetical protein A2V88_04340 [Elusimicrobia bacterium RBG_16_66_12]|nr:MAG: hypothetical protein A2V88_04340 [Elusimicrobia bacterium RBG_16_66_12]